MNRLFYRWMLSFSLVVGVFVSSPIAHAVQVLEGVEGPAFRAVSPYRVQIIEGDAQISRPPVPDSYEGVGGGAAALRVPRSDIPSLISTYNRQMDSHSVSRIAEAINVISGYYRLDSRLLASLVAVESSFNPVAISRTGAIGLGQLKPATAQWLGIPDPYDPVQNLVGSAKYLRFLLDRYHGSTPHALAAYFQGQGTIDKRGIDESAHYYISKIAKVYSRFQ